MQHGPSVHSSAMGKTEPLPHSRTRRERLSACLGALEGGTTEP